MNTILEVLGLGSVHSTLPLAIYHKSNTREPFAVLYENKGVYNLRVGTSELLPTIKHTKAVII